MQNNLRERIEREAALAAENLRVKEALDNASTNVMIADNDRRIIYMNKSVTAMLSKVENDLRKELPQFNVGNLLGGSIDDFHKKPEHQRQLLAQLTDTYRAEIVVAGHTFALTVNPIRNASNERVGTVVEWLDRTAQVAADKMVETEFTAIASAAAFGDFSQRVPMAGKTGVAQVLAQSINEMLEITDASMKDMVRVLGALARGDLTDSIQNEYQGTFAQLKDDTNGTVQNWR